MVLRKRILGENDLTNFTNCVQEVKVKIEQSNSRWQTKSCNIVVWPGFLFFISNMARVFLTFEHKTDLSGYYELVNVTAMKDTKDL